MVGSGDLWFVAPAADRWRALVVDGSGTHRAKLALWVDRDGPLPEPGVRRLDRPGTGAATASPTAEGLPGPVPVTVTLPAAGCWEVAAGAGDGAPRVVIAVR